MIKLVCLLRRADHLSPPEFRRWWLDNHSHIVRRFPGLRRYVVSQTTDDFDPLRPSAGVPPWDGVAELWFDDLAALRHAYAQAVSGEGRDDTHAHVAEVLRFVTVEHEIPLPGNPSPFPAPAWFDPAAGAALPDDARYLTATVGFELTGQPAVALRLRDSRIVEPAPPGDADYTLHGDAAAWRPLLDGRIGLAQALNAGVGGLRLSGDGVRAAGDMWALDALLRDLADRAAAR